MPRRVRLSPAEAADKHVRRTTQAVEDMRRGVEAVTDSPTAAAAKKLDKMRQKWIAAMDSGKVARGLQRVSLDDWKTAMLTKGVGRVASGVEAAKPKLQSFYTELFAYEDSLLTKIDGMADLTLEDSVNRASTWIREMSKFKRG